MSNEHYNTELEDMFLDHLGDGALTDEDVLVGADKFYENIMQFADVLRDDDATLNFVNGEEL